MKELGESKGEVGGAVRERQGWMGQEKGRNVGKRREGDLVTR